MTGIKELPGQVLVPEDLHPWAVRAKVDTSRPDLTQRVYVMAAESAAAVYCHATRTPTGTTHAHRRAAGSAQRRCPVGHPALRPGRARMILASAEGLTNSAVARRCGVTQQTVGKWRRRFRAAGIEGLHDELRPGRPRTYDDDKVAAVISRALQESPDVHELHGTTRNSSQRNISVWLSSFP